LINNKKYRVHNQTEALFTLVFSVVNELALQLFGITSSYQI